MAYLAWLLEYGGIERKRNGNAGQRDGDVTLIGQLYDNCGGDDRPCEGVRRLDREEWFVEIRVSMTAMASGLPTVYSSDFTISANPNSRLRPYR